MRWLAITFGAYLLIGGLLHFPGSLDDVGPEPGPFILGGITGLLIGGAQLFALRGRVARPWLWPVATAAGMAITHEVGDGLSPAAGYLPVAIVAGVAVGALQALVLRSPLWGLATGTALFIGIFGGYTLAFALGYNSIFEQDATVRQIFMVVLSALLYPALTAPVFARIRGA